MASNVSPIKKKNEKKVKAFFNVEFGFILF